MVLHARWKSRITMVILLLGALLAQLIAAAPTRAQVVDPEDAIWLGAVSPYWSDPDNWVDGQLPEPGMEVFFPASVTGWRTAYNDIPGPGCCGAIGGFDLYIQDADYELLGYPIEPNAVYVDYPSGRSYLSGDLYTTDIIFLQPGELDLVGKSPGDLGQFKGGEEDWLTVSGEGTLYITERHDFHANLRFKSGVTVYAVGPTALGNHGDSTHDPWNTHYHNDGITVIEDGAVVHLVGVEESPEVFEFASSSTTSTPGGGRLVIEPVEHTTNPGYYRTTLTGNMILSHHATLEVGVDELSNTNRELFLENAISGGTSTTGNLTIDGGGLIYLWNTAASSHGNTTVAHGTVLLSAYPSPAIPGNLVIGHSGNYADVIVQSANQIADTSIVNLGPNGYLGLNTLLTETINYLKLTGGTVYGDGTIKPTTIRSFENTFSAYINSNLSLGAATRSIYVDDGDANEDLIIAGVISGNGGILKLNPGVLRLSADNTYTGGTTVQAGYVKVMNPMGTSSASGTGTGAVTIKTGGQVLGTGRISGYVTVENGGTLSPGAPSGLLRVGGLTLNPTAVLSMRLGTPGLAFNGGGNNDYLRVNGNLTLDGILNLSSTTGFGSGTYQLIHQPSGTLTNGGIVVGTKPAGYTSYTIQFPTPNIQLTVAP